MTNEMNSQEKVDLKNMGKSMRKLIDIGEFEKCEEVIRSMIGEFPHAPQPHNIYGILYEKEGKHVDAMKHFRAAWALDPTYLPARLNLETYGTFCLRREPAYDESDCPEFEQKQTCKIEYDERGIGYVVRRNL